MPLDHHTFERRFRAFHPGRDAVRNETPAPDVSEDGTATVRLYDPIDSWGDWWGVSAKEFAQMLDELPDHVTTIDLHINSPGGDVFDGIAIMNALRAHSAEIVATVDGIAASAASFVAASADTLIMAPNSELMIHDAWGVAVGNAADMTQMAELLDHVSDNIASVYARKAGGAIEEWRAAMQRESWFSAEEAVAAGLADSVSGDGAATKNTFDLTVFSYAGRTAAPAPVVGSTEELNESDPPPGETDSSEAQSTTTRRSAAHLRARHIMKENA